MPPYEGDVIPMLDNSWLEEKEAKEQDLQIRVKNRIHPRVFDERATRSTSNKVTDSIDPDTPQITNDGTDDNLSETRIDLGLPRLEMPTLQEYLDKPNKLNQLNNEVSEEFQQTKSPPTNMRRSTRQRVPNC